MLYPMTNFEFLKRKYDKGLDAMFLEERFLSSVLEETWGTSCFN
jgi:hypothetical protein